MSWWIALWNEMCGSSCLCLSARNRQMAPTLTPTWWPVYGRTLSSAPRGRPRWCAIMTTPPSTSWYDFLFLFISLLMLPLIYFGFSLNSSTKGTLSPFITDTGLRLLFFLQKSCLAQIKSFKLMYPLDGNEKKNTLLNRKNIYHNNLVQILLQFT